MVTQGQGLSATVLLILSIAAISCQPGAGEGLSSPVASLTPEALQTRMVEEVVEKVETEQGVETRKTVREFVVTPAPPLEELVEIEEVETDDQVDVVNIEVTPGTAASRRRSQPDSTPRPPQMSFFVVVTSRNQGPANTIRTKITLEDPSTSEMYTTELDEFVDSGRTTSPHLGFYIEEKRWIAHIEVRVIR